MIKILIVIGGFMSEGGCERALVNLLNFLTPDKYDVDLLVFSKRGYHYNLIPNYIHKLPLLWELDFYTEELIKEYRKSGRDTLADIREKIHTDVGDKEDLIFSWEELKDELPQYKGYDVAVSYNMGTPMRFVVEQVQAKRKMAWVHFDYSSKYTPPAQAPQIISSYVDKLDYIICVTDQNRRALLENCSVVKEEQVLVLSNIYNVDEIVRLSNMFVPSGYKDSTFNIFTSSRITFDKGIDALIEVAEILKETKIKFKWFIAGQKSRGYEKYIAMIHERKLSENIELLGFLKNPFPYYKYCDLYVHPSPYEGRSMAVEEAKILCCPIVLRDYPSAKDSIDSGKNGLICGTTAKTLAEGIISLYNNSNLCKKFVEELKKCNYDNEIEKYKKIFGKVESTNEK